jgi:hypothetical protein
MAHQEALCIGLVDGKDLLCPFVERLGAGIRACLCEYGIIKP